MGTGLTQDRAALVLVMHGTVLTDGVGGIAVLAALADDPCPSRADTSRSRRPPGARWQALRGGSARRGGREPLNVYALAHCGAWRDSTSSDRRH